jgi:hypothetical protein
MAASLIFFNLDARWDVGALYFFGAYAMGACAYWAGTSARRGEWLALLALLGLGVGLTLAYEYRERIVFELESKTKSFVLTGDSLLAAKAYYTRSCFCLNRGNFKINGGSIKGKLLKANNWKVDLDLIITPTPERGGDPFSVKVSGTYKLSNPK